MACKMHPFSKENKNSENECLLRPKFSSEEAVARGKGLYIKPETYLHRKTKQ